MSSPVTGQDAGILAEVSFSYRPEVLEELARHGLRPAPTTSPEQLRDAVRDLYKYEIKRLRRELLAGRFPKNEYAGRVVALRGRYPLLSIPTAVWVLNR
jgi:hypothetical protein